MIEIFLLAWCSRVSKVCIWPWFGPVMLLQGEVYSYPSSLLVYVHAGHGLVKFPIVGLQYICLVECLLGHACGGLDVVLQDAWLGHYGGLIFDIIVVLCCRLVDLDWVSLQCFSMMQGNKDSKQAHGNMVAEIGYADVYFPLNCFG